MHKRLIVAVVLIAGVLAVAGCTTKVVTTEGAAPLYTVTATGTGITAAAPDTAQMSFGFTAQADDAKTALDQASTAAKSITDAVKQAGVPASDIQTTNVSVYPEQSTEGNRIVITGYRANVQVRAKLRDINLVGDVIGAASDAGANEINGPTFTLSEDAEVRGEAIKLAVADARKRAEVMAKAAGKSLGEIVSVSETGVSIPPIYYDRGAVAQEAMAVPIEPGELDITQNVTVVFELK